MLHTNRIAIQYGIVSGWPFEISRMEVTKTDHFRITAPALIMAPPACFTQTDMDEMFAEIMQTYPSFENEICLQGAHILCFTQQAAIMLALYDFHVEDWRQVATYEC